MERPRREAAKTYHSAHKNGHARSIPLSDEAIKALPKDSALEHRIFPVSGNAVHLRWDRIVKRAELEDLRFHDLRHEAISRFFELGTDDP
jgi:integrase